MMEEPESTKLMKGYANMMKEYGRYVEIPKKVFEDTLSRGVLNFWIYLLFESGKEPCKPGYLIGDFDKMAECNHATPKEVEVWIMTLLEMKMIEIKGNIIKIKNHSQYIGYHDEKKESILNSNGSIDYSEKFIEFWKSYPMRNGKRLGKPKAFIEWKKIPVCHYEALGKAVANYLEVTNFADATRAQFAMDAFRWLKKDGKTGEAPWEEWVADKNDNIDESTKEGLVGWVPNAALTERLYGRSSSNGKPTEPKPNKKYKQPN